MTIFSRLAYFRSRAFGVGNEIVTNVVRSRQHSTGTKDYFNLQLDRKVKNGVIFGAGSIGLLIPIVYYYQKSKSRSFEYFKNCLIVKAAQEHGKPKSLLKIEEKLYKNKLNVQEVSGQYQPCRDGPMKKKANASCDCPQPNILSPRKCYSLYLWITLRGSANPQNVAKSAANLDKIVKQTENTYPCGGCGSSEIIAGVGFGPNFYSQVMGKTNKTYYYPHRKGKLGEMPSSGGDIFVHAKSDSYGKLVDLCRNYLRCFPEDSVDEFEDIYGFDYKESRDLSGFLDVQTNRCSEEDRREIAVEKDTNGSYALTQKWVHDFCVIEGESQATLEGYVGRDMECGDVKDTGSCNHVIRMHGADMNHDPAVEIVRQTQPFGTWATETGQFFIGFSYDPCSFEFLLDRMVGASCDGLHDNIMKMSKNVKGNYWYFPSVCQLEQMMSVTKSC